MLLGARIYSSENTYFEIPVYHIPQLNESKMIETLSTKIFFLFSTLTAGNFRMINFIGKSIKKKETK